MTIPEERQAKALKRVAAAGKTYSEREAALEEATDELRKAVLEALRENAPPGRVTELAGVARSTIHYWRQKARGTES